MKLPIYTLLCSRIVRALLRGFLMTRNCHGINDNDSAFVVRNQPPPCLASLVSVEASRDLTRSHNCVLVFSAATHADAKRVLFVLNVRHRRRERTAESLFIVLKLFSRNRLHYSRCLHKSGVIKEFIKLYLRYICVCQ